MLTCWQQPVRWPNLHCPHRWVAPREWGPCPSPLPRPPTAACRTLAQPPAQLLIDSRLPLVFDLDETLLVAKSQSQLTKELRSLRDVRRPALQRATGDPQHAAKLRALDREEQLMRVGHPLSRGAPPPLSAVAYLLGPLSGAPCLPWPHQWAGAAAGLLLGRQRQRDDARPGLQAARRATLRCNPHPGHPCNSCAACRRTT